MPTTKLPTKTKTTPALKKSRRTDSGLSLIIAWSTHRSRPLLTSDRSSIISECIRRVAKENGWHVTYTVVLLASIEIGLTVQATDAAATVINKFKSAIHADLAATVPKGQSLFTRASFCRSTEGSKGVAKDAERFLLREQGWHVL